MKVPLTVPKAMARDRNFFDLNRIFIDSLKGVCSVAEAILAGVGGLYLKKIIIKSAAIAEIIVSSIKRTKKLSLTFYGSV